MKKSVYLDTTIFSYMVDDRVSLRNFIDVTREWWNTQKEDYRLYLSVETLAELLEGDYPRKDDATRMAETIEVLPRIEEVEEIAGIYIDNFLMPNDLKGDAIHLAYASYYKIDFLLTWNCDHLANANKKQHIRIINTRLNLYVPEIVTPLELFTETEP